MPPETAERAKAAKGQEETLIVSPKAAANFSKRSKILMLLPTGSHRLGLLDLSIAGQRTVLGTFNSENRDTTIFI